MTPEQRRLEENRNHATWHRWGPYLSERQWGTVREDYSPGGTAWDYFTHDMARSRAYRWGEDGIAGFGDRHGYFCMAVAVWNGRDPILKERLFGLTNSQGNHGEDVKECYWYLDGTPTHSYQRMLYRYPQAEFPYEELIRRNAEAGKFQPEVELFDLGVFDENRYFDVQVEYAKATFDQILVRVTVTNRGPEKATMHLLPHFWFRNTWSWANLGERPGIATRNHHLQVLHPRYGARWIAFEGDPELLFTENESNLQKLFGSPNATPYVKDAFHRYVVNGEKEAINPHHAGTKAALHYALDLEPGEAKVVRYALLDTDAPIPADFEDVFAQRISECDRFYRDLSPNVPEEVLNVQRQAFAGLLWSKQYYHYDVNKWLDGDPAEPAPPAGRDRNSAWRNVHTAEVLSMPDKWEYPWFAAWDLAFHTISFALVDPDFAKNQLLLLLREWYQHPNGQIPAYEWSFSDVNPPVHAWAAWRVYTIERRQTGHGDVRFLKRVFHKLLLNFTWWVNRKDQLGNNVFEGGFLGLDNIGVYDRNQPLPDGSYAEQSDGTAWMGMYCLNMMEIALELARSDESYEDVASKFFEHFIYIANAMTKRVSGVSLWDDEDGFFYDVLQHPSGEAERIRARSLVGVIPLLAVSTLEPEDLERFGGFRERMEWFLQNRPDLTANVASLVTPGVGERLLLSIVDLPQLKRVLQRVLDTNEFLSDHGVRSVSRIHKDQPYVLRNGFIEFCLDYEPGESTTGSFGGNSNWRGPIWFPLNYLLIEALQKYDFYFGEKAKLPLPAGGEAVTLDAVAADLERRLLSIFLPDAAGRRPANGAQDRFDFDEHWKGMLWFHEYFHGDTGKGLGASHQTGWTGVIAKVIQQLYVTHPES